MADYIIGIDVGVRGAICVMARDGSVLNAANFPVIEKIVPNSRKGQKSTRKDTTLNLIEIAKDLNRYTDKSYNIPVAYMELVHSMPKEGAATSFKFGLCRGQMEGILAAIGIPMIQVTPREWQKTVHSPKEIFNHLAAKIRSRNAYKRLIDPFADRVHDGIIDATLIALYGQRRLAEGLDNWRFK